MSFDILAFDPERVTDEAFDEWWAEQSAWNEDHGYDDPTVTTPALRAFYDEIRLHFPPMNGPDAPSDAQIDADPELESRLTDYSIGTSLIYAAFSWSLAEAAESLFVELARKHRVAVALVSETGGELPIIRPQD